MTGTMLLVMLIGLLLVLPQLKDAWEEEKRYKKEDDEWVRLYDQREEALKMAQKNKKEV